MVDGRLGYNTAIAVRQEGNELEIEITSVAWYSGRTPIFFSVDPWSLLQLAVRRVRPRQDSKSKFWSVPTRSWDGGF